MAMSKTYSLANDPHPAAALLRRAEAVVASVQGIEREILDLPWWAWARRASLRKLASERRRDGLALVEEAERLDE